MLFRAISVPLSTAGWLFVFETWCPLLFAGCSSRFGAHRTISELPPPRPIDCFGMTLHRVLVGQLRVWDAHKGRFEEQQQLFGGTPHE